VNALPEKRSHECERGTHECVRHEWWVQQYDSENKQSWRGRSQWRENLRTRRR
jgi:hypothetical protein